MAERNQDAAPSDADDPSEVLTAGDEDMSAVGGEDIYGAGGEDLDPAPVATAGETSDQDTVKGR